MESLIATMIIVFVLIAGVSSWSVPTKSPVIVVVERPTFAARSCLGTLFALVTGTLILLVLATIILGGA